MTENEIKLKPISELKENSFFIPSYQRGYRWTKQQVEDLLIDIDAFSPEQIKDSWYCLQPIVVKKRVINGKQYWEVIDGQQRLTTIFLILLYLKENLKENSFEIEYETRLGSANYLKNELGKTNKDDSNIDYFHISTAYQTIKDWFLNKGTDDVEKFKVKFNDSTKVIWYETNDTDSIDIFTRINMGKIPLTNAELIKALFLNNSNFKDSDPDKLRLKQLEIATEWDKMEYALQDDSFWYFLNKDDNPLATRIEFIFDLIANKTKNEDEYQTFRHFNDKFQDKSEEIITANWKEIKKCYQTLEEWFTDRELFHKIGFLVTTGTEIKDILSDQKVQSKTAFKASLREKIKKRIKPLEELAYNEHNSIIRNVLLLHNIETMLNLKDETNRFPFDRYKKYKWDIEHIHAIATNVKVKKEQQKEWLENNYVQAEGTTETDIENIEKIKNIKEGNPVLENDFENIINYVIGDEDNSLGNLCLLDSNTNRSYKNDSFALKRKKIIEKEIEGIFISICTKNVFMKYYSNDFKSLEIWNEEDKKSYLNNIQTTLDKYLVQ